MYYNNLNLIHPKTYRQTVCHDFKGVLAVLAKKRIIFEIILFITLKFA